MESSSKAHSFRSQAQFNDQIGAQLDLINQTLTELQADDKSTDNTSNPIGFRP